MDGSFIEYKILCTATCKSFHPQSSCGGDCSFVLPTGAGAGAGLGVWCAIGRPTVYSIIKLEACVMELEVKVRPKAVLVIYFLRVKTCFCLVGFCWVNRRSRLVAAFSDCH